MTTQKTNEDWIEELKVLLNNPRTGLKESSDTNKTFYTIIGIVQEALEAKDQKCKEEMDKYKEKAWRYDDLCK